MLIFFEIIMPFSVSAESDHGTFFPHTEIINPQNVFFELQGGVAFPIFFLSQELDPMTGFGGSINISAGYNWGGWLLGIEYQRDSFGEGQGSFALMESFSNNVISAKIQRIISKNTWKKLPEWISIVPGLGIGLNAATAEYYSSKHSKELGNLSKVRAFDYSSMALTLKPGFEITFNTGTDWFHPYIGADFDTFYDKSIGGGFVFFERAFVGVRSYPLRPKEKKSSAAEKEQIIVTEPEENPAPKGPVKAFIKASINENFTPDEDGINDICTLFVDSENADKKNCTWLVEILDKRGNVFRSWSGKGKTPDSVDWDGTSTDGKELVFSMEFYTARYTIDGVTSEETSIKTGILWETIIPNKKWKIVVNTIYFDPDAATFNKITAAQKRSNIESLDSLAKQIMDHGNVRVQVNGYANNVSNTQKENIEELLPLSQLRAETISNELVNRGLKSANMEAAGHGGDNPMAKWEDRANWWKNRRVEFIVTR